MLKNPLTKHALLLCLVLLTASPPIIGSAQARYTDQLPELTPQNAPAETLSPTTTPLPPEPTPTKKPRPTATPLKIPPPTGQRTINWIITFGSLIVIVIIFGYLINRRNLS